MAETKGKDVEIEDLKRKLESLQKDYDELKQSKSEASNLVMQHPHEFWVDISLKFNKDNDSIKALVQTKKMTVHDRDKWGRTLLIVAARYGCYAIVQFAINAGADLDAISDDKKTAMDYAKDLGYHHIEQLLTFSKLNLNIGNDIKDTAQMIHQQNGINYNLSNELGLIGDQTKAIHEKSLAEAMINIINKKLSFSDLLLNYCWKAVCSTAADPLKSDLWKAISDTCTEIIRNDSKRDWYWLKTCIIPSTIWFKELVQNGGAEDQKDAESNQGNSRSYLYYELLKLVDNEAMNQLNKLDQDLKTLASQNADDWDTLTKWDVVNEYVSDGVARQDIIPNGVASRYTYSQLSITSGYTFNSPSFYNYKEYLSQLVLVAQLNDERFQTSVQEIYKIDKVTNEGQLDPRSAPTDTDDTKSEFRGDGAVIYQRGPPKTFDRARQKAMGDYANEAYPGSACVLDFNRCALIFNDISTLLRALQLFVNKVKYYKSGAIIGIARCKNGFIEYVQNTQYSDVKLNVIIKGEHHNIIGEVQFLLNTMKLFKDKAHRLYAIQRQEETMESSVRHFLPVLLNDHKQLFNAGCKGDVKALCDLMVIHNFSIQDIVVCETKTGNSILHKICSLGGLKALLFLKSIMDRQAFLDQLFLSNIFDIKPIEYVLRHSHTSMVKHLFRMEEVKQRFTSNDDMIWRLCFFLLVRNTNKYITEHVLSVLGITKQKVQDMMSHQYQSEEIFDHFQAYLLKKYTIMGQIVSWADSAGLQRLFDVIGEVSFCESVFVRDGYDLDAMQRAIKSSNIKAIKYMLAFKETMVKYTNDNDLLLRLVSTINKYFEIETAKCVIKELDLTQTKLNELKSYKDIDISQILNLISQ